MIDGTPPLHPDGPADGPGGAAIRPAAAGRGSRPAGYPREYELFVDLRDGERIKVRPILPDDAPALKQAIEQADPDTVRRRFLGARPRMSQKVLSWLTVLDYQLRFALVALDPRDQRGIAVARYVSQGDGVAEVALVVDPAWRRRGVATVLAELLAQAALERGIHSFTAYYMAQNAAVTHMIELSAGRHRQLTEDGNTDAVMALDRTQIAAIISRLASRATALRLTPAGDSPSRPGPGQRGPSGEHRVRQGQVRDQPSSH